MDSLALWQLRFDEAKKDIGRLRELEKAVVGQPGCGPIRFRIASRIVELKKASASVAPLAGLLSAYGVAQPDGRWLYQYRLEDHRFEALQGKITAMASSEKLDVGFGPALFVLWAAEWFRRHHPGGLRRWEDLENVLKAKRPQSAWRQTTERGLKMFARPLIRATNFRYFLSTLAREGGFPSVALKGTEFSWASAVMSAIVATLLGDDNPTDKRALMLAEAQRARMPAVFADDDFVQLCADLALAIVGMRKSADAEALNAGIPVTAWLDAKKPGWKRELPVSLDGEGLGLIRQLMTVRAQRLASGYIDAARYLARVGDEWVESAVLELNGDLGPGIRKRLVGLTGRVSVFAAGELARYAPGELAYVDEDEGNRAWMHSLERRSDLRTVPFRCPIDLEIRSAERLEARVRLPGGDPVRGSMLVTTIDREREGVPVELLVRGTTSGKYRHEELIVRVPSDWRVRPTAADEEVTQFAATPTGALWRIRGGAVVISNIGDCYRLLCGQAADSTDRIELTGAILPAFVTPSDPETLLLQQPVSVRLLSGQREARSEGRLFMRSSGATGWQRIEGPLPCGHYELAWREGDVIRDKRRLAVVPQTAQISRYGSGRTTRYEVDGWTGCTIVPAADAPVRSSQDRSLIRAAHQSVVHRSFDAAIRWPDSEGEGECPVRIDFPCGAGIARWNGRVVQSTDRISLADLDDLVAYADGHMEVHGRVLDGTDRVIPGTEMRWAFEDEMSLSVIADDLRRALLPAGTHARVQLGMHDGVEVYWKVTQFTSSLRKEPGGLVSPVGIVNPGVELCARELSNCSREVAIASYSLDDSMNHRPVSLPGSLAGPTIAYLREGDQVITRPLFDFRGELKSVPSDPLSRAMTAPDYDGALHEFLTAASGDSKPAHRSVTSLIQLVASLRGVPPTTFRVLELLPAYPVVLARMLAATDHDDLAHILALEDELPFAWFTIPREIWHQVMGDAFDRARKRIVEEGLPQDADHHAASILHTFRLQLNERNPILCELIFPAQSRPDIRGAAQRFLTRYVDRVSPQQGSIFRDACDQALPKMMLDLPEHCREVLDAPCAAALAAKGIWTPSNRHVARLKLVARRYPTYFKEAFASCMAPAA